MSRYEKGHKEETHRRVVEIAAERFRADGIDGVGVASLMADAGLTHGGFYAHFSSKEALVKEAVVFGARSLVNGTSSDQESEAPFELRSFIEAYLSPEHRDKPAKGCVMAALGPEIARHPRSTRNAFGKEAQRLIARIASGLPKAKSSESNIATACGVFAQMIGCLQLSRVVTDKAISDSFLSVGRANALQIAGLASVKEAKTKEGDRKTKKH